MTRSTFQISLVVASTAAALAACIPSIRGGLDQAGGDAPLVVDLDATTPLVLSVSGTQVTTSVRGPNKGAGERGGVTGSFTGNGGPVCVIMDPANLWEGPTGGPTDPLDDGDSDLFVGRSADFTGSPGVRIGEFRADYLDALGVPHEIDENLCVQADLNGLPGGHGGAAAPEYCAIQTEAGVPYMLLAETISAPPSSQILKIAFRISIGNCPVVDENTLNGDNN